ncbi:MULTISPECIES: alpha/beta fold hydrolase [Aerococcus]|uniref:alpha/beta fold hydrolase n=1 Tax=Aerococcus urinae (strain CCUG 59500 / ACS-120-V-Col10a) TaxID=2976812 RepID=UPI000200EA83|nr:alpha/beta hydrolase [Aerococcus sp. Group 1]AEA00502.1 hydrolase, alpha/beta domain protein [Aerococcus sp. Group 1]MCY3031518.1 alpha/beta hydrolase [Aerococcus sp. Group 1]MCY3055747.1 alpha/beta hydrolase [Aerococcus sp. Group 1]MCY3057478.1 alpha/beta hydrolase [Aerococcus sp. Group 1]MCY3062657.1 alpha/beta hydrolase [Aerococcus sp. Group 1]
MKQNFKGFLKASIGLLGLSSLAILLQRKQHARQSRIRSPQGIQENVIIQAGGIPQALQLRGNQRTNPVILWVHGGPGMANPFLTYAYQPALEEDYTFAYWSQRGAGRTYYLNQGQVSGMTLAQVIDDMDEVVDYLRARFKQEKIFIIGHSWGSQVSSLYIKTHPHKVKAYLGVSQIIDIIASQRSLLDQAESAAQASGDEDGLLEIRSLKRASDDQLNHRLIPAQDYLTIEQVAGKYLPGNPLTDALKGTWLALTAPDFSWMDIRWYGLFLFQLSHYIAIQAPLMIVSNQFKLAQGDSYQVPVYFVSGGRDWTAPFSQVFNYYQSITAPDKAFYLLKDCGHSPYLDDPDRFADRVRACFSHY